VNKNVNGQRKRKTENGKETQRGKLLPKEYKWEDQGAKREE
jgi:hypothetical protein